MPIALTQQQISVMIAEAVRQAAGTTSSSPNASSTPASKQPSIFKKSHKKSSSKKLFEGLKTQEKEKENETNRKSKRPRNSEDAEPTHALVRWHSDGEHSCEQVKKLIYGAKQLLQEGEIVQCRWRKKTADPQDVTILLLAPKRIVEERLAVIKEEAKAVKDKERRDKFTKADESKPKDSKSRQECVTCSRLGLDREVSESKLKEMEILLSQKQVELDEARIQLEDEKRKTILFKDSFTPENIEKLKLASKNLLAIFGNGGTEVNDFHECNDNDVLHPCYPTILLNSQAVVTLKQTLGSQTSTTSVFRKVITCLLDEYVVGWQDMLGSYIIDKHNSIFQCALKFINEQRPDFTFIQAKDVLRKKLVEKRNQSQNLDKSSVVSTDSVQSIYKSSVVSTDLVQSIDKSSVVSASSSVSKSSKSSDLDDSNVDFHLEQMTKSPLKVDDADSSSSEEEEEDDEDEDDDEEDDFEDDDDE